MDVHRCRFVPFQPSAINAIAFSHPKARSSKHTTLARLAIGRANGDIEIWNPSNGAWHQEQIIRGGKDRSIDGLVWVNEADQDLGDGRVVVGKSRLFSIGYTSTVTEWDLEKGKPKRHASGQHGDIWCIAAQPSGPANDKAASNWAVQEPQTSNKLIAGTIDGELVMYSIEDDDLRFQRVVVRSPTKKAQMVSIAFQSRKVVIVGCSDSTIRAYDITKGHLLRRMTLGSDLVGGSKEIIVWSVQCLPGGNIVSGDSTGQLCIWDGKTYTQTQRIQSHKQDILSLATSADGTAIMSGGMDRRTVLYKPNGQRWSKVWGRRYHNHDVKCMATFESGRLSVAVSGGPDANPVVMPLKEMGRENHRVISNLPQQPPIASARKARFVISWWEREVHVWILRKSANDIINSGSEGSDISQNRKLLKTIVVRGDSNISDASINEDGTLLVVSSSTDVKAFQLQHNNPVKPSDVQLSSIELPSSLTRLGASQIQLSPNGSWVCLVQEGHRVTVAEIQSTEGKFNFSSDRIGHLRRLGRHIPRYVQNGGLGSYDRTITNIAFSADSKMLAVADLAGYIDTWISLDQGDESLNGTGEPADDSASGSESESEESGDESSGNGLSLRWVRNPNARLLPKLPSAPAVLSFSEDVPATVDGVDGGSGDYSLLAITGSWNVLVFHPREGTLTPWSRRNPRRALPAAVLDLLDLPKGVTWQGSRAWIYGVSFLVMLDLDKDLPKVAENSETSVVPAGTKRKRVGPSTGAGGKMLQSNLVPHKILKHVDGQEEDVEMGDAQRGDESNSDDDEFDAELTQVRNGNGAGNGVGPGSLDLASQDAQQKAWWLTYKYRPIFGVVPLEGNEIALVERPTWDVEAADRYLGKDE
ncbi:unnamed protein product [Clonostachys solani]|uniref:U3 small nucleolar RNA-associated protein 4 n=1 Tax=Clonostachys solani TaxID=160281 RepID=A0A9N9Z3C5_9HYPO|nr:unnamed protein product [Clonostachys solani]